MILGLVRLLVGLGDLGISGLQDLRTSEVWVVATTIQTSSIPVVAWTPPSSHSRTVGL